MDEERSRAEAVRRRLAGQSPAGIARVSGRSDRWVRKWVARHGESRGDASWARSRSRAPKRSPNRTPEQVRALIVSARRRLVQVHAEIDRLLGRCLTPDLAHGGVALLVCEVCGDLDCGALTARLEVEEERVVWSGLALGAGRRTHPSSAMERANDELANRGRSFLWPWQWGWRLPLRFRLSISVSRATRPAAPAGRPSAMP